MDEGIKEIIERVNIILSEKELSEDKTLDKEKLNDVLSKSKEKVTDFVNDFIYKGLKDKTPKEEMINIINNFCEALKEIEATACANYLKPLLMNKLDKDFGKSILRLLQDTCRLKGMTVIIITHNTAITPMADRVIHINSGKVTSTELNENPLSVEKIEW